MSLTSPNFTNGFAKTSGESAYPNLWVGLVGLWVPELGKQGDRLYDFSGHGHHGTLNGMDAATDYVAGKFGFALDFDGSNDNITCGNIPEINTGINNMSVLWRMKTTNSSNNCIISYDDNDSLSPSADFYIYQPSTITFGGFGDGGEYNSTVPANDEKWHHCAIIKRTSVTELWFDGILRFSQATANDHVNYSTGHIFRIADNSNVAHFSGQQGDIRLYNRDLSSDEIRQSYLGASPLTLSPLIGGSSPSADVTVETSILEATGTVVAPTITVDVSITASILEAIGEIVAPSAVGDVVTVTPSILEATGEVVAPTITATGSVTLSILSAAGSLVTPTVTGDEAVSRFASKIVHYNPLLFVTNDTPAVITKVDITDPENPTYISEILVGTTNALGIAVNEVTEFAYVSTANGLVVKVDLNNLSSQTIIDLSDTDELVKIEVLESLGLVLVTTDSSLGEIYVLDERETFIGDTDFELLLQRTFTGDTQFDSVEVFKGDTDLQVIAESTFIGNCQFDCLSPDVVIVPNGLYIPPIPMEGYVVFIDNVQLSDTDVSLNTVSIVHAIDQKSIAIFKLTRRHDRLNQDLAGNTRTITSQNVVRIELGGRIEFNGKVSNISPIYGTTDQINLTAEQEQPQHYFNPINLPLPGLTEKLNLYHVLAHSPNIDNPYIDPEELNPRKYKGIFVPLGKKIEQSVARFLEFDEFGSVAAKINAGTFDAFTTRSYFWSPTVTRFGFAKLKAESKVSEPPKDAEDNYVPYHTYANPRFRAAGVALKSIFDSISSDFQDRREAATAIFRITGFNSPFQNLGQTTAIHALYVGTSLSAVTEDLWVLTNAKHRWQRIFDDKISRIGDGLIRAADIDELTLNIDGATLFTALQSASYIDGSGNVLSGFKLFVFDPKKMNIPYSTRVKQELYELLDNSFGYRVGSAPYKTINTENGQLIAEDHYEDDDDGLYLVRDRSYNFIEYAKRIADLEYLKLLNINGTILPDTSTTIDITLDAYYYYGVKLLSRINIDNTTETGIFKNNTTTGFPVAVKSITINSGAAKVTLQCDNAKSTIELAQIDGQFPNAEDDEFNEAEKRTFVAQKGNLKDMIPVE